MNNIQHFLNENSIPFKENEPLSLHTSFKIGGAASIFAEPENEVQLKALLAYVKAEGLRYFVIGKGSNLLVSDEGFDGVVIHLAGSFKDIELLDECTIKVGAACPLMSLCDFALKHSLSGLEFAYGIPGSVGGAVFMNAGAYGGETKDAISSASYVTTDGKDGSKSFEELDLSYRHSCFSSSDDIVTSAIFKLEKGNLEEIKAKMMDLIGRRKDKQPLEYPSAGSTFKRPEGYFAGALIEQSGLKGYSVGGAQVSEKHAGFVINKGNATCADVLGLIEHCQKTIMDKFGVKLETEVRIIK